MREQATVHVPSFLPSPLVGRGRSRQRAVAGPSVPQRCEAAHVWAEGGCSLRSARREECLISSSSSSPKKSPRACRRKAAKDLERLVVGALSDRGLLFEAVRGFAGPRRLTLAISGLPAKQPDVSRREEGPAHQRAREGDRRLPEIGRPHARSVREARRSQGRFLCRGDPSQGPRRRRMCSPKSFPRRSRSFPGRNPCAGAPARSAGCARSIRSSRPSTAKSCRSKSRA